MVDWDASLYDPIYSVFAVTATIDTGTKSASITAINQTGGIEINTPGVDLPTIAPAALVRASEMSAAGLSQDAILGAALTMGGVRWNVDNVAEKPGPDGKGTGEWLLLLSNGEL